MPQNETSEDILKRTLDRYRQAIKSGAKDERTQADKAREAEEKRKAEVHEWRKDYALKVYNIICLWLIADFLLVVTYSFGAAYKFFLPDKTVIIAFISTATITVLGLFAIVMRWLFPGGQEEKGSISKDKGPAPDEE